MTRCTAASIGISPYAAGQPVRHDLLMRLARELIPYFGASAVGLAIDVSLLWLQVSVIGIPYLAAAAISFLTGTVLVYWASIRHIFGFRRLASARNEFVLFVAVGLVGLAINLGVIYIGVSRLELHYVVAKIGAAGFTFLANFAMRRWLLFTPWASVSASRSSIAPSRRS
jgi:putative flippase GtrA